MKGRKQIFIISIVIVVFSTLIFILFIEDNENSKSEALPSNQPISIELERRKLDSLYEVKNMFFFESELDGFAQNEEEWKKNLSDIEYAKVCKLIYLNYDRISEFSKAKIFLQKGLKSLDQTKHKDDFVRFKNNFGHLESKLENFDRATEHYFDGLNVLKSDTLNEIYSILSYNLGNAFRENGDIDIAINYYKKSKKVIDTISLIDTIENIEHQNGFYHGNIGYAYALQNENEKADFHLKKAVSEFRAYEYLHESNIVASALASNFVDQGKLKEADSLLVGILEESEKTRQWEVYVETCISLFKLNIKKGDTEKAFNIIDDGLQKIGDSNSNRLRLKIYDTKAEFFHKNQDYERAFEFLNKQIVLKDSVFDESQNEMLRELGVKYQTDRKNDQIAQLEVINSKEKRIKQIYLFGLLFLLFVLVFIFFLLRRISVQKKALQDANQTKDELFSIIAHDLRSPILALQGMGDLIHYYIQQKDEEKLKSLGDKTKTALSRINHLLQNLLEWALTNKNQINFKPEKVDILNLIQQNIKLVESLSFAKNINIKTEVESKFLTIDKAMMSTVIRNILSNALTYSPSNSEIKIRGKVQSKNYLLSFEDEAGGIPKYVLDVLEQDNNQLVNGGGKNSIGLGLKLVKLFVKKNKGKLEIKSTECGSIIKICISLQ
ncbi:MAG: ATP-binding protein [Psychroflexus sp.]